MKTKQLYRVALALIGMGLSLSVWAEPLIVKIGSAAPKTGGIGHLGVDNEYGAQLAINEINAKGDLTIAGKKVLLQLVGGDDEGDPRIAPIVAQELVDEGVVAVVGHLNSGASIPGNRVYSKYGMVQISPSSTNPDYTVKSNRTPKGHVSAYRVLAHDGLQGGTLAKYLTHVDGIKRVAILDDGTQYGQGLAEDFARRLLDSKIKVVSYNQATDKTTDFQSYLKEINSLKAQVVFWGGMDDTGARLVRQMRQRGMSMLLITGDGACTDKFVELAGASGEGMLCSQSGLPLSEMKQGDRFRNNYEQMFEGQEVQIYAPFAYDAVYAIVEGMKIANATEREAIAAAMPKVNFVGLTGRIRFDKRGDIINGAMTIFKVKNQRLEVEKVMR